MRAAKCYMIGILAIAACGPIRAQETEEPTQSQIVQLPPAHTATPTPEAIVDRRTATPASVQDLAAVTITPGSTPAVRPSPEPSSLPAPKFSDPVLFGIDPGSAQQYASIALGTQRVYAVWDYEGMREDMVIRRVWRRNSEPWIEREEAWDYEEYGERGTVTDVSIYDLDLGLVPGYYQVDIYIDDVLMTTGRFSILGYDIEPLWSPDESLLALVKRPGTLIIQREDGSKREYVLANEIGHLGWFPDGKDILYTDVDRSQSPSRLGVQITLWMLNLESGKRQQVTSSEELIHSPAISTNERFIAGIAGTGYGDACLVSAFLAVLKFDAQFNRTATYKLADFTGFGDVPDWDPWFVHPRNITWRNGHQFTVELWEHCLPSFENGIYLFDMNLLHAERIADLDKAY